MKITVPKSEQLVELYERSYTLVPRFEDDIVPVSYMKLDINGKEYTFNLEYVNRGFTTDTIYHDIYRYDITYVKLYNEQNELMYTDRALNEEYPLHVLEQMINLPLAIKYVGDEK